MRCPTRAVTDQQPVRDLLIWQWNCNGYHNKRATLTRHLQGMERKPDVIMIQETLCTDTPQLQGYRAHAKAAKPLNKKKKKFGIRKPTGGVCTFVRKGIVFLEHELTTGGWTDSSAVEVIVGKKKRKTSVLAVNVYSSPRHRKQKFRTLMQRALRATKKGTIVIGGDFNAPHYDWGYDKTTEKGRDLLQDATDAGLTLITNPETPTRTGTSVARDTTPDLTFVKIYGNDTATWKNTKHDFGSDHMVIEIRVPLGNGASQEKRTHRYTNWEEFRRQLPSQHGNIEDIEAWSKAIVETTEEVTTEIETDDDIHEMDSRLAHLIEAKTALKRRWNQQRTNRRLRKKIAEINREIEKHSKELGRQQWEQTCREADGQLHLGKTWRLLRHLLDDTQTKGEQQYKLSRIIHKAVAEHGEAEVKRRLDAKYLPVSPKEKHPEYQGAENIEVDQDIEEWEVRNAMQDLNRRSASGPDRVSNKALRNLNDAAVTALTAYFNKCWRAGKLPRQWKEAKTILIPKPGKPPDIENLRPISLTSCVGKLLEHILMTRWQQYLEEAELYPDSLVGFRSKLGTQDAMLQLKKEIVDYETHTSDNRAILGLDLQSAFDKVRHSAILAQVSHLNMGQRSYNYIRDFLTDRTTHICAGDLQLPEKTLGSEGTPQGAVISPLLFNLVMIEVANRLRSVDGVRHTVYADDVTLWVTGGSDGHIENTLQEAVKTIEDQLKGSGLVCSPAKSELMVIPPRGASRKKQTIRDCDKIRIRTQGGHIIPEVTKIRVLGMIIERSKVNGATVSKLEAKTGTALRLIRRVANRRSGMKEARLVRLIQAFVISHITYVAAFHNWRQCERKKIDAMIRKAYKSALGLLGCTSTQKLEALGLHNSLEEIAEAQQTAQLTRLSETRTGRSILKQLGIGAKEDDHRMQEQIPRELGKHIVVSPIPRNMTPTFHQERREARAKALIALHASDEGAVFVDAASYKNIGDAFSVSVIGAKTGEIRLAASVRTTVPSQAEEVAVALAIADPRTKTVLCDSRTAVRNFAKQRVCSAAARILRKAEVNGVITSAVIKWFPAHAGTEVAGSLGLTNHNETANSVARGLAGRAPVTAAADVVDRPEKDTMDAYNEVTLWYRLARRTMALPHPRLTREEAVVFRQLQTNSVITPVLAKHLWPEVYVTDLCRLCGKERATLAHILEDCECANADNSADVLPPLMEEAKRSEDYDVQHTAIQQILAALEKQRPDGMEAERVNPSTLKPAASGSPR